MALVHFQRKKNILSVKRLLHQNVFPILKFSVHKYNEIIETICGHFGNHVFHLNLTHYNRGSTKEHPSFLAELAIF